MKTIFTFLLAMSLLFLLACQQKSNFTTVTSDEFNRIINTDSVQVIDVRTELEYSKGHIHGAMNINVLNDKFDSIANAFLSKNKTIAVYCKSGRRSKIAALKLTKAGFHVYNLDKGIKGWTESGYIIEK